MVKEQINAPEATIVSGFGAGVEAAGRGGHQRTMARLRLRSGPMPPPGRRSTARRSCAPSSAGSVSGRPPANRFRVSSRRRPRTHSPGRTHHHLRNVNR